MGALEGPKRGCQSEEDKEARRSQDKGYWWCRGRGRGQRPSARMRWLRWRLPHLGPVHEAAQVGLDRVQVQRHDGRLVVGLGGGGQGGQGGGPGGEGGGGREGGVGRRP